MIRSQKPSMNNLYKNIIDDVIRGIREAFMDEGVPDSVRRELRRLWETKLKESGTFETEFGDAVLKPEEEESSSEECGPNQHVLPADLNTLVTIEITMPPDQNRDPSVQDSIAVQVPAAAILSSKLQEILSLPAILATLERPFEEYGMKSTLQKQINAGLLRAGFKLGKSATKIARGAMADLDAAPEAEGDDIPQADGQGDSSSDEDSGDEKLDDLALNEVLSGMKVETDVLVKTAESFECAGASVKVEVENPVGDSGAGALGDFVDEQEGCQPSLNHDDDLSDEEITKADRDLIDNVIICQYEKIVRSRNKWKFVLKDGIMHLKGKDYVFHKATGDAEW